MKKLILIAGLAVGLATSAFAHEHAAPEGVVVIESPYSPAETLDRLAATVEGAGGTIFARIDHAKGAAGVGMDIPANQVLIFGNPKLGTPVMQLSQGAGLDLPLRVQAWSHDGTTYVAWRDPKAVAKTHGIDPEAPEIMKIVGALTKLTGKATAAE